MTTMEKIGLGIGTLIVLLRLPAIVWPEAYVRGIRSMILEKPLVVRTLGALLLLVAATIVALVAETLTLFQAVMLVVAVLLFGGGMAMLMFTDGYRAFSERVIGALPDAGVRLGGVVGVALGIWIVVLSLSVR
jgi:hypothetical protein